jgi:hypothetical protein
VKLLAIFIALLVSGRALGQPLALHLDNVPLGEGVEVRFSPPLETGRESVGREGPIGQSKHFLLYRSARGFYFDDDLRLFKYELLVKRADDPGLAIKYEVKAEPFGRFTDRLKDVNFQLTGTGVDEVGSLRLALHSIEGGDELKWKDLDRKDSWIIRLGGERRLPIEVQNTLTEMRVAVKNISVRYADAQLWTGKPAADPAPSAGRELSVQEGWSGQLTDIVVTPSPWRALNTFFSSEATTKVQVEITYAVQSGGRERPLNFEMPVRFEPDFRAILLALILGSLLGVGVRFGEKKRREESKAWWKVWGFSFLGSSLAELTGVVLIFLGSEFKLFTVKLDPYNIAEVALMAAVVGWRGLEYVGLKKLISKEAT